MRSPKLLIRSLRPLLALALGTRALSACALLQRFSFAEPTIHLAAVHVRTLTPSGGSLDLLLDVHNPNPYALRGGRFEGDLAFEDTPFGAVSREAPWTLPAQSDTSLTVQLAFSWTAIGPAARAVLDRGSVRYRLGGRVLVGTPVDERWIQLEQRGEVPIERLLR